MLSFKITSPPQTNVIQWFNSKTRCISTTERTVSHGQNVNISQTYKQNNNKTINFSLYLKPRHNYQLSETCYYALQKEKDIINYENINTEYVN